MGETETADGRHRVRQRQTETAERLRDRERWRNCERHINMDTADINPPTCLSPFADEPVDAVPFRCLQHDWHVRNKDVNVRCDIPLSVAPSSQIARQQEALQKLICKCAVPVN